ncbi:MAG: FmdE family protein [Syntrophobacteraceae bacterium]|jgi:formylmethanofuran dehydrogenase subunit E
MNRSRCSTSCTDTVSNSETIGRYSYPEYLAAVKSFHGYDAPGLMMGGFMVNMAMRHMPGGVLYDAVSETRNCLPDAIQLLTPCTMGNGWLRILNLGRYALSLYDKKTGEGVRVFVDAQKARSWPEVEAWFFKLKGKEEQDSKLLLEQIRQAGEYIYGIQTVLIQSQFLTRRHKGRIGMCALCEEAYPVEDGAICRACQGEAPYVSPETDQVFGGPAVKAVPLKDAVGKTALHDMTMVVPGISKGPAFVHGQRISAQDLRQLQRMGRQRICVQEEQNPPGQGWVHENEAAQAFAQAMAGEGVRFLQPPREGKINFVADRSGIFVVNEDCLEEFNMIPGVMCASRKSFTPVSDGRSLAGTRAIPLFLQRSALLKAMSVLRDGPIFRVLPLRKARVGILVTGSEVFQGIVKDKFIPIIGAKAESLNCRVVKAIIVPDDRWAISDGVRELIGSGVDLLVTTAGLSVDPDDVTRQGLIDAGATDILYGAPVLPGAMVLLAHIGSVQVLGVPACALYSKTTSFDLLFPRLLADLEISRRDLAKLGHGSFCLECKACTFPKCPFGG